MSFPFIDKALLEELDKRFPERSAELDWSERGVWHKSGQRSVVRFLQAQYKEQNEDLLNQKVLGSDV